MTNSSLNKVEEYLKDLFSNNGGILLGDNLKDLIVKSFNKSDAAARKAIERAVAKNLMQSSKPVSFGRGTLAYFPLEKKITFDELLGLTKDKRPPLHRLLSALKKNKGVLSYYEALKISGTPINNSTSKITSLETLISELTFFNLIVVKTHPNGVKFILSSSLEETIISKVMSRHYASMIVDTVFLYDVIGSLKKLNLIDNQRVVYRNRRFPSLGAQHNNFTWDAFAYTKTTGINTFRSLGKESYEQMALVVMDVVVSRNYDSFDLDGFFARIQVLKNNATRERKIIPIIVFKEILTETLNRARAFGAITYSMSTFFGAGIEEIIDNVSLIKTSELDSEKSQVDPIKLIDESLEKINSTGNKHNLQNVIGDFFQSLMFQLFNHIYAGCSIDQSLRLPAISTSEKDKGKYFEYDFVIFSSRRKEIIVIEVKGYNSNSTIKKGTYDTQNTLKWFFNKTFPSAKEHFKTGYTNNYQTKSLFVTSARYDTEGQAFLNDLNNGKQKPHDLDVGYDGKKLLELVDINGLDQLKRTLEKYFIVKPQKAKKQI